MVTHTPAAQKLFRRRLAFVVAIPVLVTILIALGGGAPAGAVPATQPGLGAAAFVIDRSVAVRPYLNLPHRAPQPAGAFAPVPAFPNLSFRDPTVLLPVPRVPGNFLVVAGREGLIEAFENNPLVSTKRIILDLSAHTQGWDDCGLLGLAFHPEFAVAGSPNRGYFYVWYSHVDTPRPGDPRVDPSTFTTNRLSRFTVPDSAIADGSLVADPASEYVLIDQDDRNLYHNGGGMFFGPDGMLFLSLGDEGGANDVFGNSQRIDRNLFSGVIRIDVDQRPALSRAPKRTPKSARTQGYWIPNDNPFVGDENALGEFYAIGLRNPHRMTLDPVTNTIWAGDIGQDAFEEVDVIEKGGNYGWSFAEGPIAGQKPRPTTMIGTEKTPFLTYPRNLTTIHGPCVIGGYVYRGKLHPALYGKYIMADYLGPIWAIEVKDGKPGEITSLGRMPQQGYAGISGFGTDADGELYMCQLGADDGKIFKLARTDSLADRAGPPMPKLLSQTGAFADLKSLTPAPGLVPYAPAAPFWSDGASKQRWIAVPNDAGSGGARQVHFSATGKWTFPAGTVFVKHFDLPADPDVVNATPRRLETRFLVISETGAPYAATYRWRADESDADLVTQSSTVGSTSTNIATIGDFSGVDIGSRVGAPSGSTTRNVDPDVDISSAGGDIWGTADSFHFAYRAIKGDFDIAARIDSFRGVNPYSKAGLMARASLDGSSAFAFTLAYAGNQLTPNQPGYDFEWRERNDEPARAMIPHDARNSYPNTWVRLQRIGTVLIGYSSADGKTWSQLGRQAIAVPETVYVGAAVSANAPGSLAVAQFRSMSHLKTRSWDFFAPADCMSCHTAVSGGVLGVNTRQMNSTWNAPGAAHDDNQLLAWARAGLLDSAAEGSQVATLAHLSPASDLNASLEQRARSYLDTNCSQCHQPNGVGGYFDARYDTPLAKQNLINGIVRGDLGIAGAKVLIPGDSSRSVLYQRITTDAPTRMPPLGRHVLDEAGAALIREWIESMR